MAMPMVSSFAPNRCKIGSARSQNTTENRSAAQVPPQKDMDEICRAPSVFFLPSARARALEPPTPNRFEIAVSMSRQGATMVIAAVCAGSFKSPTK